MQRALAYSFVEVLLALFAAATSRVWHALQAYGEARARAAAQRDLQFMSDHLLRDIGMQRSDLHS